jgi:hypothetical protein
MKKALVAIALAGITSSASALVAGSNHDLSATGPFTSLGGTLSACQYCHAPHNVNTSVSGAPLWNRNSVSTVFVMYTSSTLRNPVATTPNANSMTCLSCHDGVSDMGATYVGARGFAVARALNTTNIPGTTAVVGADLRNDHPVSVRYVGGTGTNYAQSNAVVAAGFRLYTYTGVDYVECASCHDPHNQGVAGGNFFPFLRVSKTTMCTTCHLY